MFQYEKNSDDQMQERKQISIGNARVNKRIAPEQKEVRVVQKQIWEFKGLSNEVYEDGTYKEDIHQALSFFADMAKEIDLVLGEAYDEFMEGNFEDVDQGYLDNFLYCYDFYRNGGSLNLLAMAAGYVIENKVNNRISDWDGIELQNKNLIRGSRPDIVISCNGVFAVLDITASNNCGHILYKNGNWLNHNKIIYVAELLYPSIDFDTMQPIELTQEEQEMISQANQKNIENMMQWKEIVIENYSENRREIINSLILFKDYIYSGNAYFTANSRWGVSLINNFDLFGIQLKYQIVKDGFCILFDGVYDSRMVDWEKYSCIAMDQRAGFLIDHIRRGKLIGMKSII